MKSIREKFEKIWPVPEGVYWREEYGNYDGTLDLSAEWDYRLDTFIRCQETTDVYVSLVDELVNELESALDWTAPFEEFNNRHMLVCRAKQIMEQSK